MPQVTTECVEESCDHSGPIRGQYSGHVITLGQSEAGEGSGIFKAGVEIL